MESLSSLLPPPQQQGPYRDASARTSTTRVDIDHMDPADSVAAEPDVPAEPDVVAQQEEQEPPVPQTPQTTLTFLLVSGRRRTMAFDPATTIGRVKELIWNAWPSDAEWQAERPPAPSYLRILYLGKILQDEDTLTKLAFPSHTPPSPSSTDLTTAPPPPPPTIVHLSIRAYAPPAEDAPKKKKPARRRGTADTDGGPASATAAEDEDGAGGALSRMSSAPCFTPLHYTMRHFLVLPTTPAPTPIYIPRHRSRAPGAPAFLCLPRSYTVPVRPQVRLPITPAPRTADSTPDSGFLFLPLCQPLPRRNAL
ncbi:hypothetical protein B0H19DRAFT_1267306 [Mycena capillaripes]|nr:hypothetical protein B0H19DRAFT_1267306 [Mycena capillaripes]